MFLQAVHCIRFLVPHNKNQYLITNWSISLSNTENLEGNDIKDYSVLKTTWKGCMDCMFLCSDAFRLNVFKTVYPLQITDFSMLCRFSTCTMIRDKSGKIFPVFSKQ